MAPERVAMASCDQKSEIADVLGTWHSHCLAVAPVRGVNARKSNQ